MSASGRAGEAATPSPWVVPIGSPFTLANGQDTGWIDTGLFGRWLTLQITANATPNTLTFDQSNDQAQVSALPLGQGDQATPTPQVTSTTGAAGTIWAGWVSARYVRIRCTAGAGTATFNVALHPTPGLDQTQPVDTELIASASLADGMNNPTTSKVAAMGAVYNGATWDRLRGANGLGDAIAGIGLGATGVYGYNGGAWDRQRIANVFKAAAATAAGDTALWTPAAGKKFRLLAAYLMVTGNATQAAGGVITVALRDATTALAVQFDLFVPSVAVNVFGNYDTGWLTLGNGILSALANNVLNINLSAALTAGDVKVIAVGVEE